MPYTNAYQPYSAYTAGYQSQYAPMAYQQPVNGLIKVNGYESAMQYQLPPNSVSPVLLSANEDVFYIKRTDGSGVGTVEQYDFAPHKEQPKEQVQAVTREEFDSLAAKVEALSKPTRRAAKDAE